MDSVPRGSGAPNASADALAPQTCVRDSTRTVVLIIALTAAGALSALAWVALLADTARRWRLLPIDESVATPPEPATWPCVGVVIPARNEEPTLASALPSVLAQDYPGEWHIVVVDDRSTDATRQLADTVVATRGSARRCRSVAGAPLPPGWVGKVWALEQGARELASHSPAYLLLTDADIRHEPASLRRLVAESEQLGLSLNSRMARLRCEAPAERLLIPAFVYFFNLLYPMRCVNDPASSIAAAAGGCVLLRSDALTEIGGFEAIRGEIIDDVNLARRIKTPERRVRLAISRAGVLSVRAYGSVGAVWHMVRRTAFDELGYSWARLAAAVAGLALLFPLPPALVLAAAALAAARAAGLTEPAWPWIAAAGAVGALCWSLAAVSYGPAVRLYGLGRRWRLALPLAGLLYAGMTVDSARVHRRGPSRAW